MELGLKIRFLAPSPCFSHHTRLPYIFIGSEYVPPQSVS